MGKIADFLAPSVYCARWNFLFFVPNDYGSQVLQPVTQLPFLLLGLASLNIAQAGPAINQFELKDLEVEVGRWEFQSQNAYSWNQPDRNWIEVMPGEYAFDGNSVVRQQNALELEYGFTSRFRLRFGVEWEQQRIDDPGSVATRNEFGSLEREELALESVFVLVPVREIGVGFGLLAEYQYTVDHSEADSIVFGPIVEMIGERWSIILNPAVVRFFGGTDADVKLDFTYAIQLAYSVSDQWLLAMESYGTIERLGNTGTRGMEVELFGTHDLHRFGPIAYYQHSFDNGDIQSELRLGAGILVGLNDNTPDGTFKLSIEYEF